MNRTLFLKVIDAAPLVSIDLIVRNPHAELRWWPRSRLVASASVHANTKAYFL